MDYPELQRDVLEDFVEVQQEAKTRFLAQQHIRWGHFARTGRFAFPTNKTELGAAPAVVSCAHCRRSFTCVRGILRGHPRFCPGRPQ